MFAYINTHNIIYGYIMYVYIYMHTYTHIYVQMKEAFASIWETDSLLISMDTIISWRPWWDMPESEHHVRADVCMGRSVE